MKNRKGPHDSLTLGVVPVYENGKKGIYAAFAKKDVRREDDCGILMYDKNTGELIKKHTFPKENRIGSVRYDYVEEVESYNISYLFFEGEERIVDKRANAYLVTGKYGKVKPADDFKALLADQEYDWENTVKPQIPYEDSILYCLHVRGFTKHITSGVLARGTFAGIMEKLPYLRGLGITGIELQPCYEFDEIDLMGSSKERKHRVNYWGYKEGCYYAPKSAYADSKDAVKEFKDMIKSCHKNGLEVIMQFYFPDQFSGAEITKILRHWTYYYQVDGFHLMGNGINVKELSEDPYLADEKLLYHDFSGISFDKPYAAGARRLAVCDDSFMVAARRYLKGDGGITADFLCKMRRNPKGIGQMNYMADHSGFTMFDMVSYNQKHNNENGENGIDGTDQNFSWNCGEEGRTKTRSVLALRQKQLRNAFTMLFLAQGTPCLFMGDEFGNSQEGNNNPYCQDNQISWLNWEELEKNENIYAFVKMLIELRKKNRIFHLSEEFRMKDYKSCGYPDLSMHNEQAWMPAIDYNTRNIGLMLCGEYAEGCEGTFWYIAMNMHWEPHKFVMPGLPEGMSWKKFMSTESIEISEMEDKINQDAYQKAAKDAKKGAWKGMQLFVAPRSIAVYIGKGNMAE